VGEPATEIFRVGASSPRLDPLGLFTFNRVQDFLQRGDVRPVTFKDFVEKRQAFLGDRHGQNQLRSVQP
jgi:hypothetical protein